jgi:hypothetical protein
MRSRLSKLAGLLGAVVIVSVMLAGCGGSSSGSGNGVASKSPDQIVAAAKQAAASAATVHIAGSTISENKPISLDMELVAHKGAKGHLSVEGLGIEIIALEHAFYLNGSAAFYRHVAGPTAAQLLQGRWLKAPSTAGEFASLSKLTDLGTLLESTLASHGALTSAGTATINGQQAVGVTDTSKKGTLWVAATGTPYPLEIAKGGTGAGKVSFDRWNQPVTLTPPPNPININQLQNGH